MEEWKATEIEIGNVKQLLEEGYEIEVDSPDGYVPVNFFVDKGMYEEYLCTVEDDNRTVSCNCDHLFETPIGWVSAEQIFNSGGVINILDQDGTFKRCTIEKTGSMVPIVDINVDHDNHRYYTNGLSSHNTGVGKSLFMCHMGAAALAQSKNVLYITMEMAEERIAERIDANLFDLPIDQLENLSQSMLRDRVKTVADKTNGKLIIKEYPTGSAHAGHFRALLNELKLKKNFEPQMIFIDYLNICSSSRMKSMGGAINSYTYIKAIAEELRGLAVEFNVPIVTATQTTRSGYGNSDVGLEDTSESFGLPATADFMFALISSEELEANKQIMVKQLKNRYNDPGSNKRFVIGVDRSKMKLYDVEESAQSMSFDDSPKQDKPQNDYTGFKV